LSALDRKVVQPVAVDVTALSTASFLAEHHLNDIPVIVQVDPVAKIDYRFQLTPQTLLISRSGTIEKVWSGVLDDATVADIKKRVSEEAALLQLLTQPFSQLRVPAPARMNPLPSSNP
jgi:hypothetical protein